MKESDHNKLISKPSLKKSFLFGVASGTAMVMFIMAARLMGNAFSLPELAADWFTAFLPPRVLDFLLLRLSFSAKPLMFVGLLLAQVVAGGVLAVIVWASGRPVADTRIRTLAASLGIRVGAVVAQYDDSRARVWRRRFCL